MGSRPAPRAWPWAKVFPLPAVDLVWRRGQSAPVSGLAANHDHGNDRVMQMAETLVEIETCRVRPGMFVHLDLGWMDHPFPWNRFKVRSEDEVRILCDLV